MDVLTNLYNNVDNIETRQTLHFSAFVKLFQKDPHKVARSVFQLFYDMIKYYVGEGTDEYPNDPESIGFMNYDFTKLLVDGIDEPFFVDRLFANKLVNLAESMIKGAQQNRIYIFKGPPGCGKSVFLNSLLKRFQEYANSEEGTCYELVWRLKDTNTGRIEEIPCPCHGHPLIAIPKNIRHKFIEDLVGKDVLSGKEYEWLFKKEMCAVCASIYNALSKTNDAETIFKMIYAKPRQFDRKLGEGISVYNPADKLIIKQDFMVDPAIQKKLDSIFGEGAVKYIYSRNAPTNNGIYALMDIKDNNITRFNELHNIVSEGVRKVDTFEEKISSLFIAVTNAEDTKNITNIKSYEDRILYIHTPYVLNVETEINIYRHIFGKDIEKKFLPHILENFAKIVISTRLKNVAKYIEDNWLEEPYEYTKKYCDIHWHLLKMDIYSGKIPTWLSETDRKNFTASVRRELINKSEDEGDLGFSGRTSISLFNEFYTTYSKSDSLINMQTLFNYFKKVKNSPKEIVTGFLESLMQFYHYTVLQEMKEAIYDYNKEQIDTDIKNYLFALNWDIGDTKICDFTCDKIEITTEFLYKVEKFICDIPQTIKMIEGKVAGTYFEEKLIKEFRENLLTEYTSVTLGQEMLIEKKDITETKLYKTLFERYTYELKEKVLETLQNNFNFRAAIKDYGSDNFNEVYDEKIRRGVKLLINNLQDKFCYTEQGAIEVCIYMLDNSDELKENEEKEEVTKEELAVNNGGE
jgi:predicted Ser/Thr protein kinase